MYIVKTRRICKRCDVHHVKDLTCPGDIYTTVSGEVRQSFCPICGLMSPPVSIEPNGKKFSPSNRQRKKIANLVAVEFKLDFGETHKIAKDIVYGVDFLKSFSIRLKIAPEDITSVIMKSQAEIRV